jgi:sulfite exporter TauE/SafE
MVSTISPVVYRNTVYKDCKWIVSSTIYVVGSMIGAAAVGTTLSVVGSSVFMSPNAHLLLFAIGMASIMYSLHELNLLALPYPQRKAQVPSWWRYRFHPYITAWLFGLLLGMGVTTFIPTATFYIIVLIATFSGSLVHGAFVFLLFGTARAVPLWLVGRTVKNIHAIENIQAFVALTKPIINQFNGALLAVFGAFCIVSVLSY